MSFGDLGKGKGNGDGKKAEEQEEEVKRFRSRPQNDDEHLPRAVKPLTTEGYDPFEPLPPSQASCFKFNPAFTDEDVRVFLNALAIDDIPADEQHSLPPLARPTQQQKRGGR